jgi:nitrogenase subunit NifH
MTDGRTDRTYSGVREGGGREGGMGCAERGVMIQANVPSSQPANAASA